MNVAIEIPDDIGQLLADRTGDLAPVVLEAVAVEAYRSGAITPAQVQQMLGLRSRWETDSFLRRAERYHDYTMDDLERISPQFATQPGNDRWIVVSDTHHSKVLVLPAMILAMLHGSTKPLASGVASCENRP